MTVRLRREIAEVPPYQQGRPAPEGGFKLSSNENPFPPLPAVVEAVQREAERVNRYPRPGSPELVERLASELGVEPERILVGDGSASLLQQLIHAVAGPGDEVVYAWRSFDAYPLFVRTGGATPVEVPLDAEHRHDVDAMLAAITDRTRAVILCSPNNPTGTVMSAEEVDRVIAGVPDDVLIMLDEAYIEFVREPVADGIAVQREHDNLVVLRTFSKAYGLAGLRVGYAIADPEVITALGKVHVPFSVSSVAQAAALASLDAGDQLLARTDAVVAERARVTARLRDAGYRVPDSQANFVWLDLGAASMDFARACVDAGVVVRPFDGDGVRVTVTNAAEDDVFLQFAESWDGPRS